jgi:hypothetical protein
MYEMLVRVQDVSCETPGMMSNKILPMTMRTMCIAHAPGEHVLASVGCVRSGSRLQRCIQALCPPETRRVHLPFAFTHSAFRFGRADWSLSCSKDSGGSVYTKLLERLLLTFAASRGILVGEGRSSRGRGSPAKLRRVERLMMEDDSLAVVGRLGDEPGAEAAGGVQRAGC